MFLFLEELKKEHRKILKELGSLEEAVTGPKIDAEKIVYFLTCADKLIKSHHRKERDFLFFNLKGKNSSAKASAVKETLSEYMNKEDYSKRIKEALKSKDSNEIRQSVYFAAGSLKNRIFKEESLLFLLAEDILSDEEKKRIDKEYSKEKKK